MDEKILTVTIPSYNVEAYLEDCLESFVNSEVMDDIEVLIVNDGSSDNTAKIAQRYADKYENTFRLINKENGGHGSTINTGVREAKGKYFKVVGVKVTISNREVSSWCQPLIQPMQQGICAFIIKKINGVYHFMVQAKLECGNFDVMELAPTVQCLTGNIPSSRSARPPFLDLVLESSGSQVLYDTLQSEEGGRFYHEQNRNMLVEVDGSFPLELPERYRWMTLGQIYQFLRFNNYLNIQSRSLIAALNYLS